MTQPSPGDHGAPATMDRRSFLRTGLGGAVLLGGISLTAGLMGCATAPARNSDTATADDYAFRFFTRDDIVLFEALLPAIIGPGLPEAPNDRRQQIDRTIARMDAGVVQFGSANQNELRQLFDLLNFGPTRVTLARVWPSWEHVSTTEANAFLNRWRTSRVGLFNKGYMALIKVTNVAFYGYKDNWPLSGYPGPPAWAMDALPQFRTRA
ncbi:hypothetical protein [Marinobacter caseinilyticus]|uniref:hypothetical protein n=1 Tax=Marinobacter caseinilyticus TaxID=2692195 RepID=UPI00140A276D|nr:hypothetical protein [Marinobacter caseinilyticus]